MAHSKTLIDYYATTAPAYDKTRFPWQTGPLGAMEKEEVSKVIKGKSFLLECGAGSGRYALLLGKNHSFLGCDINKEMIIVCKSKLKLSRINADLILADAQRLPLVNDIFDSVICSRTFKFFDRPDDFLVDVKRCLKKGGKCIISLGLRDSFLFRLATKLRLIKLYNKKWGTKERYYFQKEALDLFQKNRFNSINVLPVGNLFFGFYSFVWFHLYNTPFAHLFESLPPSLVKPLLKIGREYSTSFALVTGEK